MKKVYFGFILLILLPFSNPVFNTSGDAAFNLLYSKYDFESDSWTNMSIIGHTYRVTSDKTLYDTLDGTFIWNPWDMIEEKLTNDDFFSLNISHSNPYLILEVDYLDESNKIAINPAISAYYTISVIEVVDSYYQRVTGMFKEQPVWPIDMSVAVMESYPEQYGIEVLIQRGIDFQDVEYEEELTLIVADYDIFAQYFAPVNGNISYVAKENVILVADGSSVSVQFDTFSVGTEYSPNDLYFSVLLENGLYIQSSSHSRLPVIGQDGMDFSDITVTSNGQNTKSSDSDSQSNGLELPVSIFWLLIPLMILPIIRKLKI
ncbi:MAG: hypothetical protein ACW99A_11165 [Candidatus Kariarchaeaceae archaeon]|jgi:hypothetical protein